MMHIRLPMSWNKQIARVGVLLGTLGSLAAGTAVAADAPSLAEQAKQRLQGVSAPAAAPSSIYNISHLSSQDGAPVPAAPEGMPAPSYAPAAAEEAPADGPWSMTDLFDDGYGGNSLKDKNIKIGGNIAQSMTFNFQGPRDKWNGPVTWTDRSNEYQLNQLWLYGEKATDTSKNDWDIGGRFDAFWGTNARLATASGLETNQYGSGPAKGINSGGGIYGLAFPNLYGELAYKKLKVRVGRFVSPIGYFTLDTTQNFFNTIPYTYQWGEPFTHTGVNFLYQATDALAVSGGIIRGWDNFDASNPFPGLLATWSYTFQDKSNLAQVIVLTREPNFNFEFTQRYYQSLVYTKPLTDKLTYVGQSDFGTQKDAIRGGVANWYGINQYMYYQQNDRLTWGVNFEWWRDEAGFRVANFLPGNAPSGISSAQRGWGASQGGLQGGYQGNFYQITFGPKWYPTASKNLFIRPNMRFDWFEGSTNAGQSVGYNGKAPYDDGTKNHQGLFVTDVVLTF